MSERVVVEVKDGIADVRMSRPEKLNAVDSAMFQALIETGRDVARDGSIRVVVLSGEGRSFCAGLDMASFQAMADGSRSAGGGGSTSGQRLLGVHEDSPANFAQRAAWVWQEVPQPVIAAVHGVAYGAGIQIALGADIRFVAPDARLSIREVHWGLIPDVAATQTARRVLRLDVAKELTFTGRVVSGEEAVGLGLATHVSDDPRQAAFELAREIAARNPHAVRAAKQLWNEATLVSVEAGLALEASLQRSLIGTPNQVEAIRANLEKRPPAFRDPE